MKKINFLGELKEMLEIEDENFSDDAPINLTSLGTLSVIVFVDENFNKQIISYLYKTFNTIVAF